jgi:hypothetical protein
MKGPPILTCQMNTNQLQRFNKHSCKTKSTFANVSRINKYKMQRSIIQAKFLQKLEEAKHPIMRSHCSTNKINQHHRPLPSRRSSQPHQASGWDCAQNNTMQPHDSAASSISYGNRSSDESEICDRGCGDDGDDGEGSLQESSNIGFDFVYDNDDYECFDDLPSSEDSDYETSDDESYDDDDDDDYKSSQLHSWSIIDEFDDDHDNSTQFAERFRMVTFHESLVTDVRLRPRTANEDVCDLYYSAHELQRLKDYEVARVSIIAEEE